MKYVETLLLVICSSMMWKQHDHHDDDQDDEHNDTSMMSRAHSFPRAAEFRAEPRNLVFFPRNLSRGIPRNLPRNSSFCRGIPRNLTFFFRTTIF